MLTKCLFVMAIFSLLAVPARASADHVFFVGTDNHVHEYYYLSGVWYANDDTANASAPATASNSPLTSLLIGNSEHVFYIDQNLNVGELYWNGAWHYTNDTAASGAPQAESGSSFSNFTTSNNQFHLNYTGTNGHVNEIWWNGTFHYTDDTAAAGAPLAASRSPLTSVFFDNQEYVFYVDTTGTVNLLYWNGSWNYRKLGAGAIIPPGGGLSSFDNLGLQNDDLYAEFIGPSQIFEYFVDASLSGSHVWEGPYSTNFPAASALPFTTMTHVDEGDNFVDVFSVSPGNNLQGYNWDSVTSKTLLVGVGPSVLQGNAAVTCMFGNLGIEIFYPDYQGHIIEVYGNDRQNSFSASDITAILGGVLYNGGGLSQITSLRL